MNNGIYWKHEKEYHKDTNHLQCYNSGSFGDMCMDCASYKRCRKLQDDVGLKYDDNKLMWDLLPYDAVEKIVEIMTYGAKKYAPNNWQKVKANRYYAAMMRHIVAELKGEDNDKESGLLHLAHAATNILFLLWKKINEVE